MKILVTADIHLKMWSDKLIDEYGFPMKLKETLQVFDNMCKYATDNGIKTFIIAGDVNDLKNIVHYKSFVALKNIIDKYQNLMFYIISGNHDEASREDIMSAIQLLSGSNVKTIVREPYVHGDITFLPWSHNMLEALNQCEPNKLLISHFGLNEAKVNSKLSIKSRITLKNLKNFDLVILGHYHLPQQIKHVYYTGSPIQLNKGEAGEEKRFLIVDTETLEVESIPTEGYRKYYIFNIEDEKEKDEVIKTSNELTEQGHYVTIKNKLQTPIEIDGVQTIHEYEDEDKIRGITTGMPLKEQLKKYLDIMNVPEEKHNEYINVALSIISNN